MSGRLRDWETEGLRDKETVGTTANKPLFWLAKRFN